MKVSKEMAEFFYTQCVGTTSGHMASIPNNPVLYGLVKAHGGTEYDMNYASNRKELAEFLFSVAEHLSSKD